MQDHCFAAILGISEDVGTAADRILPDGRLPYDRRQMQARARVDDATIFNSVVICLVDFAMTNTHANAIEGGHGISHRRSAAPWSADSVICAASSAQRAPLMSPSSIK